MRRGCGVAAGVLLALGACGDPSGPPGDLPDAWTAVAAGDYHTCALAADGGAYCWGSNEFGQLGSGGSELEEWPRRVAGGHEFAAITSGFGHSCALTVDGEAYCWGLGDEGQLGHDSGDDSNRPVRVSGSWRLRQIDAGHSHTCGVSFEGEGVCWGDNSYGQLGTGTTEASRVPVRVSQGGVRFSALSAAHTHTCGTGVSGITYCWGGNRQAQLGNASFNPTPLPASVHTREAFLLISAGFETTCALTPAGAPFCWGSNDDGRLAAPPDVEVSGNPRPVPISVPFIGISAGPARHICGVSWSGTLHCWGGGGYGQLGHGELGGSVVPVTVAVDERFVEVSTGLRHSCALSQKGAIYCWGDGRSGQLGNGSHEAVTVPVVAGSRN